MGYSNLREQFIINIQDQAKYYQQIGNQYIKDLIFPDPDSSELRRHFSGLIRNFRNKAMQDWSQKDWKKTSSHSESIQAFDDSPLKNPEIQFIWDTSWEEINDRLAQIVEEDLEVLMQIDGETITLMEMLNQKLNRLVYLTGKIVLLAQLARELS